MTRSQNRILAFLLRRPGAAIAEIAKELRITRTAVSAQVKSLRDSEVIETVLPDQKKGARYYIRKEQLDSVLSELTDSPADRLGSHCVRRYKRALFRKFRNNVSGDHKPVGTGVFDVQSVINAAVTTDPQLKIVSFSPRFKELVEKTTPDLLDTLESEDGLKYVASPGETSWLGALNAKPFDWEVGDAKREDDACFGEDGIWERILRGGVVDAYAFETRTTKFEPIFLDFYIAPQRTFLGYQSIVMNVGSRVVETRAENVRNAYYDVFHHALRQPLQQICATEVFIHDALKGRSEDLHDRIASISGDLSVAVDRCTATLEAFRGRPNSNQVVVPVLFQLSSIVELLTRERRGMRRAPGPIRILNENIHRDEKRYLTTTVECLQYGALFEFLRNAQVHGHSEEGTSVDYHLVADNSLRITIADKGAGLSTSRLEFWNETSEKAQAASVSDIGKKDGMNLAIMGIKTSGGTVRFSATDSETRRGMKITILLPVKEVQ